MKELSYLHDIAGLKALDVLKDQDASIRWLTKPNTALGGISPFTIIETEGDKGFEKVITILNRIEHGIFS